MSELKISNRVFLFDGVETIGIETGDGTVSVRPRYGSIYEGCDIFEIFVGSSYYGFIKLRNPVVLVSRVSEETIINE